MYHWFFLLPSSTLVYLYTSLCLNFVFDTIRLFTIPLLFLVFFFLLFHGLLLVLIPSSFIYITHHRNHLFYSVHFRLCDSQHFNVLFLHELQQFFLFTYNTFHILTTLPYVLPHIYVIVLPVSVIFLCIIWSIVYSNFYIYANQNTHACWQVTWLWALCKCLWRHYKWSTVVRRQWFKAIFSINFALVLRCFSIAMSKIRLRKRNP